MRLRLIENGGAAHADPRLVRFRRLLAQADVEVDGKRPWDLQIHDPQMPQRVLAQGSMGLGDSYVDGWWDCERIDELVCRVLRANLDDQVKNPDLVLLAIESRLFNRQSKSRSWTVGRVHYDIGSDFFAAMLDPYMAYSCGYWAEANDLAAAQQAKLDLICQKLRLKAGMRLLDIGCGWGSLMRFAAEHYGVECTGITISRSQAEWGQTRCEGLPVEFVLADYRDFILEEREPFDRIASVGMFEHVGHANYRPYFSVARRVLRDDGLMLLHTIGKNLRGKPIDPWIERNIFPNGELPSLGELVDASEPLFVVEDVHNFGADYDRTLMGWHERFAEAWPMFRDRYGERFGRMWRYYLLACAGTFRARHNQLWQVVLSPTGVPGGYRRPV